MYVKKTDKCMCCGELAHAPRHADTPQFWNTGQEIKPKKTKRDGVICPDCQWAEFSDFCGSQGVSPYNPVKYIL